MELEYTTMSTILSDSQYRREEENWPATQLLLDSLKAISTEYDKVNRWVQKKSEEAYLDNKDKTFRDIHEAQQEIRVTSEVLKPIHQKISMFEAHFSELDEYDIEIEKIFEQKNGFRNSLLDIAIHTMGDCHHMSKDLRIRELMIRYEKIVILPIARYYFRNSLTFEFFGRITVTEENLEMEFWNRFGDEKPIGRGAYQTFGSLLRNGFFLTILKVLQHRMQCRAFQIPEVFLGNLLGWIYCARLNEDYDILLTLIHMLSEQEDYKPSPGVRKTIERLNQKLDLMCPLDRIEDYNLLPCDNLLEESIFPTEDIKEKRKYILYRVNQYFGVRKIRPTIH